MFASLLISFLFVSLTSVWAQQQQLFDVPSTLFDDGIWRVNVNYMAANSTKMYNEYKLTAPCTTRLQFQELFCLGKSLRVIIANDDDPAQVQMFSFNSTVPYNCAINIQDPAQAILIPQYSKGEVLLPAGNYSVQMRLVDGDTDSILGFRGFAVRASIPIETIVLASKCRSKLRPNGPISGLN